MTTTETQFVFSAAGGGLGLVGSLILAYSLNPVVSAIRANVKLVEETAHAAVGHDDVPVFTGFERQVEKGLALSAWRVRAGALILALGFLAQVAGAAMLK